MANSIPPQKYIQTLALCVVNVADYDIAHGHPSHKVKTLAVNNYITRSGRDIRISNQFEITRALHFA